MEWKSLKIGDFLKRIKQTTVIKDTLLYKRITIRTKHQGISMRDELKGSNIGTKKQFIVNAGQFLLSKIDARLGAFGVVPEELDKGIITGNFWAYEVDKKQVNIDWFNLFTSSGNFYEICNRASSGTTHRKYLNERKFLDIQIKLPSIEEQNSFLKEFKNIKDKCSALAGEFQQQTNLINQLHGAILQDAIQGNLIKQNPKDESAQKLLEKIKGEQRNSAKAGILKNDKSFPVISKEEIPFDLPKTWEWCRLGEICDKIGSGSTPRGGKNVYKTEGIKFIRSQNVYNDGLYFEKVVYIDAATHSKMSGTKVLPNDLLINITGGSIGRCAVVPSNFDEANVSQHVTIIRLTKRLSNKFIHNFILSPYYQKKIMEVQTGGNREGLAKKNMELMLVPIPPLAEQHRIVAKVEELTKFCESLHSQVSVSGSHAENLLQSVLKESLNKS